MIAHTKKTVIETLETYELSQDDVKELILEHLKLKSSVTSTYWTSSQCPSFMIEVKTTKELK